MAFTVTTKHWWVGGNTRAASLKVTADAATQNVNTGLKYVYFFTAHPQSATASTTLSAGVTTGWVIYPNSLAAGTQSNGFLGISNAVSGDIYEIVAFGR